MCVGVCVWTCREKQQNWPGKGLGQNDVAAGIMAYENNGTPSSGGKWGAGGGVCAKQGLNAAAAASAHTRTRM